MNGIAWINESFFLVPPLYLYAPEHACLTGRTGPYHLRLRCNSFQDREGVRVALKLTLSFGGDMEKLVHLQ